MEDNRVTSASSDKRNLGFVKLRRGLKEHLHHSRMSSNASTLFVWLLLSARHSGSRCGCVEANYEDVMRNLGWSYSKVRRTIGELAQKGYIIVTPAANQHAITTIRIPKFDAWENDSAVSTGEHTETSDKSAMCSGVLSALSTVGRRSEHSRPPISQKTHELQAPKNAVEGEEKKNGNANAVRRSVDAGRRAATSGFSLSEKRGKLHARMIAKVATEHDSYQDFIRHCLERGRDHPFGNEEREAFEALGYKPNLKDPVLTYGFVEAAVEVHEKHRGQGLSRGNLCSKVIDYCKTEQERAKTLVIPGINASEYYWPPDFQIHRDRLREQERRVEGNRDRA